jgi:hypothetical protein
MHHALSLEHARVSARRSEQQSRCRCVGNQHCYRSRSASRVLMMSSTV